MNQPTRTNPNFKVGDLVTTKMHGPQMMVESIAPHNTNHIVCMWFDRKHRLQRTIFEDFMLQHVVGAI